MARRIRNILLVLLALIVAAAAFFYVRPLAVLGAAQRFEMRRAGMEDRDVQLAAGRIHYFVMGEGRPLLLVHGLGATADAWFPYLRAGAAQGFKVYALDMLGFGESEKPDVDYTIARQVDVLRQFLDAEGIQKVDLGGGSMGGWIALAFAHSYPERVERLVLFDSVGMPLDMTIDYRKVLRPKTPADWGALEKIIAAKPQNTPEFIARDIVRTFGAGNWVMGRTLDSMLTGREYLDGKLGNVRMPVLIVWGRQDALTPLAMGEAMHREMPQSELKVFDGCGHIALLECEAEILPLTFQFLKAEAPPAGSSAQP